MSFISFCIYSSLCILFNILLCEVSRGLYESLLYISMIHFTLPLHNYHSSLDSLTLKILHYVIFLFYEEDIMYNFKYVFINILLYIILYKLINMCMYNNHFNVITTTLSLIAIIISMHFLLLLLLYTRPMDINRKDEAVFYL